MLSKVNLVMKSPVSPRVPKIDENMRDTFVVNIPNKSFLESDPPPPPVPPHGLPPVPPHRSRQVL